MLEIYTATWFHSLFFWRSHKLIAPQRPSPGTGRDFEVMDERIKARLQRGVNYNMKVVPRHRGPPVAGGAPIPLKKNPLMGFSHSADFR